MGTKIFKPTPIILAFCISLITTAIGSYIFPVFYQRVTEGTTDKFLLSLVIAVISFAGITSLLLILSAKVKNILRNSTFSKPFEGLGRFLILILILLVAGLFVSIIYGLISTLIYSIAKETISIEQIKGIINIVTSILTFLILPIFFNIFLTFTMERGSIKETLITGLKSTKQIYFYLLIFFLTIFGIGYLVLIPFNYIENLTITAILKMVILPVIGTTSLLMSFTIYEKGTIK